MSVVLSFLGGGGGSGERRGRGLRRRLRGLEQREQFGWELEEAEGLLRMGLCEGDRWMRGRVLGRGEVGGRAGRGGGEHHCRSASGMNS